MLVLLLISLLIGIGLCWAGISQCNINIFNLGLSWISGTLVGIFCNFAISIYYRKKDKNAEKYNKQILEERQEVLEQQKSIQDFVTLYIDFLNSLNSYFLSNIKVENDVIGVGYYELCRTSCNFPFALVLDDSILSMDEICDIESTQREISRIANLVKDKQFSDIDLRSEILRSVGFIGRCMCINGKINNKLVSLEKRIK